MRQGYIADNLEDDTMSTLLQTIQKPLRIVLPMKEVKRRVIVDALDKCRGNCILSAHLLGIGKTTLYRMARAYQYKPPESQAEALRSVPPLRREQPRLRA
jgi:transcriptional regulator of acetoin/glycerol metabolism